MNLEKKVTWGKMGLMGGFLSILFFLCFFILGFLQPDYNHLRDTVSMLVMGNFGWIQTINFVILILSAVFVFGGLKKNINENKSNLMTATFRLLIAELIVVLIFPIDRNNISLFSKIHYLTTFVLILTITIFVMSVIRSMKRNLYWKKLVPYTYFVLFFNFIFGIIWFYINEAGLLFEWKGLFQKIVIMNVVIWLSIVGFKLWKLEKQSSA